MAEGKKEVWSDWIELGETHLYCSIPAEISGGWGTYNVQYIMEDGDDDEGYVVEDYTKEWVFADDNTDPIRSLDVKAWRYQKE